MNNMLMNVADFDYNGQSVRTVMLDDEPWFVLKDVCNILCLGSPHKVAERLECDEKDRKPIPTLGGKQEMTIVNESGLYAVILRSDKPEAKPFRKWVTSEVLPQIRKTGKYDPHEKLGYERFLDLGYVKDALLAIDALQTQVQEQKLTIAIQGQQISEMQPKATYYDLVLQCSDLVTTKMIAKDYGMSSQALNSTLHDLGIQYKESGMWFLYQKYADKGYTQSKTYAFSDGRPTRMWTNWTQAGRLFIYQTLKENGILPMIEREGAAGNSVVVSDTTSKEGRSC